jgi:aspartyl-tRNA(Asn)/glutamyl-tRNA(Gln) amidotransferase subunit C
MSLDITTVAAVARLARIKVPAQDLPVLADELNHILAWIEQLNSISTQGVEPMRSVNAAQNLRERQDDVTQGNSAEGVLQNAPEQTAGFFVVPKVIE